MANTPNYQGMFLRGYGSYTHIQENGWLVNYTPTTHSSFGVGVVQGDTARPIYGSIHQDGFDANLYPTWNAQYGNLWGARDCFVIDPPDESQRGKIAIYPHSTKNTLKVTPMVRFDSRQITPTANENRPINVAVRYLIRCR